MCLAGTYTQRSEAMAMTETTFWLLMGLGLLIVIGGLVRGQRLVTALPDQQKFKDILNGMWRRSLVSELSAAAFDANAIVYDPATKPVLTDGQRIRYFSVDVAGHY